MPSTGYDKNFLGSSLSLPKVDKKNCAPLIRGNGNEIKYTHFSIYLHKDRRLPLMSSVNIKGEAYSAPTRGGSEPWDHSDQVEEMFQIDNRFYGNDDNTFDRGHLVRRVDPCWGSKSVSNQAEAETFRWVNCTPQHKKLNQRGGVWYQLEQHVLEHGVKNKIGDIAVFAGPVLASDDLFFVKPYLNTHVPIPLVFWKVIVWKKSDGKLYAVGFMMSQHEFIKNKLIDRFAPTARKPRLADDYFENLKFSDHKTYQVPISAIEKATGIEFNWRNVTFPYKARPFKVVKAVPLKKVHKFETIQKAKVKLASTKKTIVTSKAIKEELKTKKPVAPKTVKKMVDKGQGYLLKRYELKNITL